MSVAPGRPVGATGGTPQKRVQNPVGVPCSFPLLLASLLSLALLLSSACVRVTPPPSRPSGPSGPSSFLNPHWTPGDADAPPATPNPPSPPPPRTPKSEPRNPKSAPSLSPAAIRAIQIRLDRALFSPGGIDGRWGRKTSLALADWQTANNLPPTGQPDPETLRLLRADNPADPDLYTSRTITAADHAALRPFPDSWLDRSKLDTLAFSTIQEAIAEEFHLFQTALPELNPSIGPCGAWPNPAPGTTLVVPNVRRSRPPPAARLEISLSEKAVRLYDASDRLRARFPCSIAADKTKRPAGQTLHVTRCADHPEYTFRPELYADDPNAAGITHNLRIPPGPNNPVGLAWIGLDLPGYGIHGTPVPEKISHTESHGCFRLTNWDAQTLLLSVSPSLPVRILAPTEGSP